MASQPDSHWFVSSFLHWRTGTDLPKLLTAQRKGDMPKTGYRATRCAVYWVPLPSDASYGIDRHAPEVPGAVWVFSVDWEAGTTEASKMIQEQSAKNVQLVTE